MKSRIINGVRLDKIKDSKRYTSLLTEQAVEVLIDDTNRPFVRNVDGKEFVAIACRTGINWIRKEAIKWKSKN